MAFQILSEEKWYIIDNQYLSVNKEERTRLETQDTRCFMLTTENPAFDPKCVRCDPGDI